MKSLWKKSLPSIYNTFFHGTLIKEGRYLKYYFFYPSDIAKISDVLFDIENGEIIGYNQNQEDALKIKDLYTARSTPRYYSDDDFVFGEYRITHQGEWGYACFKNGKLLWKKSLRGYLYTDIIKYNDRIIFGTSGMGGHFYSLDINSGEIIFDFNTKGTCNFLQINDFFYFAISKKKTTVLYKIDVDGIVLDSLELEGPRDDCDPIVLLDNSIFIVTQLRKKDVDWETYYPIVHSIALL